MLLIGRGTRRGLALLSSTVIWDYQVGRRAEVAVAVEVDFPGGFERGQRRGEDGFDVGPGHGHGAVTGGGGGGRRRRRGGGRGAQGRGGARRAVVVSGEDEAAAAAVRKLVVVGAGEDGGGGGAAEVRKGAGRRRRRCADTYFEQGRVLRKFRTKSENSLFGTLALVMLQMFGRTSGSVQGARRVDSREGVGSVDQGEVIGRVPAVF